MRPCGTSACVEPAEFLVEWPGKPLEMCRLCKARAVAVASVMGFSVAVRDLPRVKKC